MIHWAFTCGFEQMEDPNYGQFMTKGSVCQRTVVQSHSFVNDQITLEDGHSSSYKHLLLAVQIKNVEGLVLRIPT